MAFTAAAMSSRPLPPWYGLDCRVLAVVPTSASLSCRPFQSGCFCAKRAAAPATWGVAIDVPLMVWYAPSPSGAYCDRAARMSTPGAVRSGLTALSPTRGPRLENSASWSTPLPGPFTAPTVSAASAAPGAPMLYASGPELPAAMTNSAPVSSLSRLTAWLSGSVPSVGSPPRLMLTIFACWSRAAHSMPARIQESWPLPSLFRTLPMCSEAPGATPSPCRRTLRPCRRRSRRHACRGRAGR